MTAADRARRYLSCAAVVAACAAGTVSAPPVHAESGGTYHVAATGSDQNDGRPQTPWRTIQKAVNTAGSGSTIEIGPGVYEPFAVRRPNLTVKAAPGGEVLIRGRDDVRDVILITADNTTVSGVAVEGCRPNPLQGISADNGNSGVRVEGAAGVRLSTLTVRDSHGVNAEGLPVGCYGVIVRNAWNTTVDNSNIYRNGYGVAVIGGHNTRVTNNSIHDNDVIVHNTRDDTDDDYGAVAIGFLFVSGSAIAEGNTIFRNEGPSADYQTDGGAFDIFESSNVTITRNLLADNEIILETGAGPGGECANNTFEANIARGATPNSTMKHAGGILLRCAKDMTVRDNDLRSAGTWMFQITAGDKFAASLDGLTITGNTVAQATQPVYQVDVDPTGLRVDIDGNRYRSGGEFAVDPERRPVPTLEAWQKWTGWDTSSTSF